MKSMRLAAAGLTAVLLLGLAACGGNGDGGSTTPAPTQGQTQEQPPKNQPEPKVWDPSLAQLRTKLQETGDLCAIAFLGRLPQADPGQLSSLLQAGGYLDQYPFLGQLDPSQIVSYEGAEVYCLVPRETIVSLTVQAWLSNESNHYQGQAGDTLYQSTAGDPIILIGNQNDVIPNLMVTLIGTDGETLSYSPSLSPCDGTVDLPVSPGVYDFSRYQVAPQDNATISFLGQWQADDLTLCFSADDTMTYQSGAGETAWNGTYYVISDTAQGRYSPGDVVFQLDRTGADGQKQEFWGVYHLTTGQKDTLTATNTGGDPLRAGQEKQSVTFTRQAG